MAVIVRSNVVQEFSKQVAKIRTRTSKGIIKALLIIKRESLKMTPVDTGNLRGSCYTQTYLTLKGPVGEIGYTASYAAYVHETNKRYRKSGTSWKFLEKAIKNNQKKLLNVIKDEAYIR